jgi:hypothetical protein
MVNSGAHRGVLNIGCCLQDLRVQVMHARQLVAHIVETRRVRAPQARTAQTLGNQVPHQADRERTVKSPAEVRHELAAAYLARLTTYMRNGVDTLEVQASRDTLQAIADAVHADGKGNGAGVRLTAPDGKGFVATTPEQFAFLLSHVGEEAWRTDRTGPYPDRV